MPAVLYYASIVLSFFGDTRHPHSFPTRRSSDLIHLLLPGPVPASAPCRRRPCGVFTPRPDPARARPLPFLPRQTMARDRKSTRLNSSHVAISYAVFCLKKKEGSRRRERYNIYDT